MKIFPSSSLTWSSSTSTSCSSSSSSSRCSAASLDFRRAIALYFGMTMMGIPRACGSAGCVADLDDIFNAETSISAEQTKIPRTYILCPNSTYQTAAVDQSLQAIPGTGMNALFLRSNAAVRCGSEGNPSDNCTITKGSYGLTTFFDPELDADFGPFLRNSSITGVTFRGLRLTTIYLSDYEGDFLFKDCIFEESALVENIRINGRIETTENVLFCNPEVTPDTFNVTFEGCIFRNNRVVGSSQPTTESMSTLIYSPCASQTMLFKDNVFENNDFARHPGLGLSSLIYLPKGGGLVMENNCFLDNDLIGQGPVNFVRADGIADPNITASFVRNSHARSATCHMASLFVRDEGNDLNLGDPDCLDADLDTCPILVVTESPTHAPTPTPTSAAARKVPTTTNLCCIPIMLATMMMAVTMAMHPPLGQQQN